MLVCLFATSVYCVPPQKDGIDAEEYKVYSDALPELVQAVAGRDTYIIYDKTESLGQGRLGAFEQQTVDYIKEQIGIELDPAIVAEFRVKNVSPHQLEQKFAKSLNVILMTGEESSAIFSDMDNGWDNFYAKYPGSYGTIEVSRVAFDKKKESALLYFGNQRDWLMGAGYYVLLQKKDGKWVIVNAAMAWIS